MTIEQQVTSMELSEHLKKLGVTQESYFMWEGIMADVNKMRWTVKKFRENGNPARCAAFTAAELGEMLRPHLRKEIWLPEIRDRMNDAIYMRDEANSRAKMLIYLIENKLV